MRGNYPGVEVVPRSRAHYGFKLLRPFEDEDPEWSRCVDPWDDSDLCSARVVWQVQKVGRLFVWTPLLLIHFPGPDIRLSR
jgi:hypothetical protein